MSGPADVARGRVAGVASHVQGDPNSAPGMLPRRPMGFTFASRRSPVMSLNGAVASSQPLATAAGYDVLRMGGNAADAAVAVAAALNVTEPTSTGIGGDAFCLFYDAKTKTVRALNGSGRAPAKLRLEDMRAKGHVQIPPSDVNSATVPGAAAAWIDTLEMFGSGRVTPLQVLQPAIDLAEQGYPVGPISANMWEFAADKLRGGREEWLAGGRAPAAAEIMSIPTLGRTFRLLAEKGKAGFYQGEVAQAIVDVVREFGGVMTLEDLANHRSTPNEPIYIDYRGVRLWEHGPNGQGIAALIALGILDQLEKSGRIRPLMEMQVNSAEYMHAVLEALKLAFADSLRYVADPEFSKVPVKELLSDEYLASRAKLIDPAKAAAQCQPGNVSFAGDTVYLSVMDKEGNACSFINSLYTSFGCGAVARGTGVILQNRGSNFSLDPSHPNRLEGGKRPFHTILPAMTTISATNELLLCNGHMGGFQQPQGQVQDLLNILRGMDPQKALDTLRFHVAVDEDGSIFCEEGMDPAEVENLRKMGHRVRVIRGFERAVFGRAQIIERRVDKRTGKVFYIAGSDPRGDGHAASW
ncbi:gamma-glutamyltranspeptidase [Hyaloraphidium curvatum]|nr:gamma-glutamyltranspeptidase [Hyaloraphidium curvatum]